jgi:hypothetical protein
MPDEQRNLIVPVRTLPVTNQDLRFSPCPNQRLMTSTSAASTAPRCVVVVHFAGQGVAVISQATSCPAATDRGAPRKAASSSSLLLASRLRSCCRQGRRHKFLLISGTLRPCPKYGTNDKSQQLRPMRRLPRPQKLILLKIKCDLLGFQRNRTQVASNVG